MPFCAVIERMKPPDFVEATNGIERVEITRVVRGELARLKVTAAQVRVAKCIGTLPCEKVKTQPAAVSGRDALRLSEKSHKQKKHQIRVHPGLKLKVARKIFRRDLAHSAFELERGVQCVIQFFHEHDQRPNVTVTQARARIVLLKLFN